MLKKLSSHKIVVNIYVYFISLEVDKHTLVEKYFTVPILVDCPFLSASLRKSL